MTDETTVGAPAAAEQTLPGHPVKRSPAHRMHVALGATFVEEAGWEIAAAYGDRDEAATIRDAVGVADVTARGKIDVRGVPGTTLLVSDDVIEATIADDWTMLFTPPRDVTDDVAKIESGVGDSAMVTDVTHLHSGYALAGGKLPDLLARLTSWNPDSLAPGSAAGAPIAEIRAVVVRRDLHVPVLEVYCAAEFGRYLWKTLVWKAGSLGGGPVGWQALRADGWS